MATPVGDLIPMGMSLGLVGHNIGVVKKKKVSAKDILSLGVTNIVGTSLIRSTAGITAGL